MFASRSRHRRGVGRELCDLRHDALSFRLLVKKLLILLTLSTVVLGNSGLPTWSEPTPEFVFARLSCTNRESWMYWPDYWPNMPPWKHDYPEADEYFIPLIHELTGVRVKP